MADEREAERVLLDRCRRGDEAAWAALYRAHAPRLVLFLRGVLGRPDVEDLVQRVFLELLSSLERFRGEAAIATWLHRIAANVAQKEARSFWRRRRKLDAWAAELDAPCSADACDRVAARQELERLAAALERLDWRFRVVWVMRELEGLSVEEVAEALGERPATVRTRHHRARGRLLEALAADPVPAPRALPVAGSNRAAAGAGPDRAAAGALAPVTPLRPPPRRKGGQEVAP